MNLLVLIAMTLAALVFLWLAQAAAVTWAGEGRLWAVPFAHGCDSTKVRGVMKAALGIAVLTLLMGFPVAVGEDPIRYHFDKLSPARIGLALGAMMLVFLSLLALYVVLVRIGWIRLERRHGMRKIAFKLLKGALVPLPLTLMEEPLFRGLMLEQLLAALPGGWLGMGVALVTSAALFAAVHFLRPQKHRTLAAIGLFYTGLILGAAYLMSGRNYLLPIALHAGGVLFIQVTRPISYYLGPAWLIGRSSYPIAGALNMAAVTLAAAAISTAMLP